MRENKCINDAKLLGMQMKQTGITLMGAMGWHVL